MEVPEGPDYLCFGGAMSLPDRGAAPIKSTLSFQTLEAALPPGMLQAADPVAREVLYMPELATISAIPAGSGRCALRDREVWMQSEPRRPQIIHGDTPPKAK